MLLVRLGVCTEEGADARRAGRGSAANLDDALIAAVCGDEARRLKAATGDTGGFDASRLKAATGDTGGFDASRLKAATGDTGGFDASRLKAATGDSGLGRALAFEGESGDDGIGGVVARPGGCSCSVCECLPILRENLTVESLGTWHNEDGEGGIFAASCAGAPSCGDLSLRLSAVDICCRLLEKKRVQSLFKVKEFYQQPLNLLEF
jgi:hypothetical protein